MTSDTSTVASTAAGLSPAHIARIPSVTLANSPATMQTYVQYAYHVGMTRPCYDRHKFSSHVCILGSYRARLNRNSNQPPSSAVRESGHRKTSSISASGKGRPRQVPGYLARSAYTSPQGTFNQVGRQDDTQRGEILCRRHSARIGPRYRWYSALEKESPRLLASHSDQLFSTSGNQNEAGIPDLLRIDSRYLSNTWCLVYG